MCGLLGRGKLDLELAVGDATILTGANGTGKSTVLRTIDFFGRGRWDSLSALPFDALTFEFADSEPIRVDRTSEGLRITQGARNWEYTPSPRTIFVPNLKLTTPSEAEHVWPASLSELSLSDFTLSTSELTLTPSWPTSSASPPDWLQAATQDFSVLFLTDRRLVVEETGRHDRATRAEPIKEAVTEYSEDLRLRMQAAFAEYADRVRALDREFPAKVLQAMRRPRKGDTVDNARADLAQVEQKREALLSAGLIPIDEPMTVASRSLRDHEIPVIRTYADAELEKFRSLDQLLARVNAFTGFMNARYSGKQIRINRDRGFVIELADGTQIDPANLSSGEQQILVLAYQVIFRTVPNTLVLIDEPELSLHVSWQTPLVDDLVAMGQASHLSFLLATHSPTLVGARRRRRRSLDHLT